MKLLRILFCSLLPLPALLAGQETPPGDSAGALAEATPEHVCAVAVAPDGLRIAAGFAGGRVALLDAKDGGHLSDLDPALPGDVCALDFSPDGMRLAGLGSDGKLLLWNLGDADGGSEPARSTVRSEALPAKGEGSKRDLGFAMLWSPTGERLVVSDWWGNNTLWAATGELVRRWFVSDPPGDPQLIWSSDGERLFTIDGSRVRVRAAKTGQLVGNVRNGGELECTDAIVALGVHPDGRLVATGHADCRLRLWNLETGDLEHESRYPELLQIFPAAGDDVAALAFSPSGRQLALSTREGSHVFVVDVASRERVWTSEFLGGHFDETMQLAWSPDGARLWFSFECGGGPLYCVDPKAGAKPTRIADSPVPRFGGSIGALTPWPGVGAVRFDGARLW